jgi:DNA adenine methylase
MAVAAEISSRPSKSGISPFRYPGGKAWMAEALAAELTGLTPAGGVYLEPYAGGAGAATRLLASGAASEIHLNDADPRVYSAWFSLLNYNEKFQEALVEADLSMSYWWECKRIVDDPDLASDVFELGFATFFLNRTNRSGILQGAAPIGGYEQAGDWKLHARFYRDTLRARVAWIGQNAKRIHLSQLDGLDFLKSKSATITDPALYFVDPPYVNAGSRLYMNGMTSADHRSLGEFLCSGVIPNWLLTYDDTPLVREIYGSAVIESLRVRYTLQKKRNDNELLIRPQRPPLN